MTVPLTQQGSEEEMAWAVPNYTTAEVDAAGDTLIEPPQLISPDALETALDVINNWRSSHSFPLNTLQCGLRNRSREINPRSLVAQRIKRLSSIHNKLDRF